MSSLSISVTSVFPETRKVRKKSNAVRMFPPDTSFMNSRIRIPIGRVLLSEFSTIEKNLVSKTLSPVNGLISIFVMSSSFILSNDEDQVCICENCHSGLQPYKNNLSDRRSEPTLSITSLLENHAVLFRIDKSWRNLLHPPTKSQR